MEPLLVGSHPAIDFLNTALAPRGEAHEVIGDGRAFVGWLAAAGLIDAAAVPRVQRRLGAAALDAAAADARRLREWARAWIARWQEGPAALDPAGLRHLNAILERAPVSWELVPAPGGQKLVERRPLDGADQLVGLVARELARLVAEEDPALIKRCAGSECTLWFVDLTKGGRRLFCSAAACGNRAKVAAFRARQREE